MDISALSALSASGQSQQSRRTIAENFDTFLSLLTTQLKNQNPLDPLDTNEFTAQLVQFSGVEQAIQTNKNLEQLLALQTANALTGVVDYIGKTVTAEGVISELRGGSAKWTLNAAGAAGAEITIRNANGQPVFTDTVSLEPGSSVYSWNGRLSDGTPAPEGAYAITVDAHDAAGNRVAVSTAVSGRVTGVDLTGSEPLLNIGNSQVKLSAVKSIVLDQS